MSFKAEMLTSDGLYGHFFKFIVDEFRKIVKDENPDLWKYIIDNHIGLRIMERYTAEMIADDIRIHKGHLRKDQMQTMLMNWRNKEECSSFQIRAHWKMINDKMRISGFVLEVSAPNLCMEICKRIYDLDNLKEEAVTIPKLTGGNASQNTSSTVKSPKTGGNSYIVVPAALLAILSSALVAGCVRKRRKVK